MPPKRQHRGDAPPTTLAEFAAPDELDPSLLALSTSSAALPIDPQLFAMEQVVHDVQSGRVIDDTDQQESRILSEQGDVTEEGVDQEQHHQPDAADELEHVDTHQDDQHIPLDDDEIDPALREIVNSLTNAQQSHHPIGDMDERERLDRERLQHTLQSTLEDFAPGGLMGSYNAIFNTNFPQSPSNLVLPLEEAAAQEVPVKRGRGRPKGSKNKPKPGAPPPPPPPPKRPRGRPPKIRTAEEEEENERRKQERAQGLRKRGRPRKYPEIGLVREMRLKKNRAMFAEKIRQLEERGEPSGASGSKQGDPGIGVEGAAPLPQPPHDMADDAGLTQQVADAVARHPVDHEHDDAHHEYWPYQGGESLLEVVGRGLDVGVGSTGPIGVDGMPADTSDEMRGVFSLPDVPEVQQ